MNLNAILLPLSATQFRVTFPDLDPNTDPGRDPSITCLVNARYPVPYPFPLHLSKPTDFKFRDQTYKQWLADHLSTLLEPSYGLPFKLHRRLYQIWSTQYPTRYLTVTLVLPTSPNHTGAK